MALGNHGFTRRQIRQGGGRGTGDDHVDAIYGCTELYVYQSPNTKPKGYDSLKTFLEAEGCEVIYTTDTPPEFSRHEALRVTAKGQRLPDRVVQRTHRWAHQRNYLHSFFKPMYR